MPRSRVYDPQLIASAVQDYRAGKGLQKIAIRYGVGLSTLRRWLEERGEPIRTRTEQTHLQDAWRKPTILEIRVNNAGCWVCMDLSPNSRGYLTRTWHVDGEQHNTTLHRNLFEILHGKLPAKARVWRSCRDKYCLNPEHLYVPGPYFPCSGCRRRFLTRPCFYADRHRPNGVSSLCRDCKRAKMRAYNTQYYAEHREELIDAVKSRRKAKRGG